MKISDISAASPEMPDSQWAEFVDDIKTQGQLIPVVMYNGEVIDGRKRVKACESLGIEPLTVEYNGKDARRAAVALNTLRTQFKPSQRQMYAAKIANMGRGDNLKCTENNRNSEMSKFRHLEIPGKTTADQAARAFGVDRSSVQKAKRLLRKASPAVIAAVEQGKITVHAASKISDSTPVDDQSAVLERVLAHPPRSPQRFDASGTKRQQRRLPSVDHASRVEKCLFSLGVTIDSLTESWGMEEVRSDERYEGWKKEILAARSNLSRVIREA